MIETSSLPSDASTVVSDADQERRETASPIFIAAIIALLTAVPLIEGKLQALEVVCLVAAPFIVSKFAHHRLVVLVSVALATWLVGQLLSDQVNGSGLQLSMQVATAGTILVMVPVLVLLSRGDVGRMRWLVVGVSAGLAVQMLLVHQHPLGSAESWKFGFNGPVSIGLLALADLTWRRGYRVPSIVALGAICALGLVTDDRHRAGIAVLTVILLLLRPGGERHPRVFSVVASVTLLFAAIAGAFIQAAEAGLLGDRSGAQVKHFGSTPQSIIVNVRPEPFQELYLFYVRPFFGWGSHPRLDSEAYLGSKNFLHHLGVVRTDLDDLWLNLDVPGVAAHSQAVDSLARAGLFAAPFWLLLIGLALWAGTAAIRFRSSPLVVFWTVLILWDSFFSPLTGLTHIELAAYLALAMTSLAHTRRAGASIEPPT